ncbi:hypothetical protein NVD81_003989, partial [Salmonella enterica]|nr:hypothetical protein [Salmonella enterica]
MMEKNNSQNVDQKIKSTVVGTGNTTIIAQVIVNTNSPDIDTNAIQNTLINEIRSSLKEEFVSTEYNILLCYPNKLIRDEPTLKIIKEIKQKLDKMGA